MMARRCRLRHLARAVVPHHACGLNLWHFPHPCGMAESGPGCALGGVFGARHRCETLHRRPGALAELPEPTDFRGEFRKLVILVRPFQNAARGLVFAGLVRLPSKVISGKAKGNCSVSA